MKNHKTRLKYPWNMLRRIYEKVFKESKLFINYMNILPKKGVVGRTNAWDIFIWKYICLHQMVKFPMSPKKNSEEKNWTFSQWEMEGCQRVWRKRSRINTISNIFLFLIRTARELYKFIFMKTLNFHYRLPEDNCRQARTFGQSWKGVAVQPGEATAVTWTFPRSLFMEML